MKKIFIITGETSGDMHAACLVNEFYKLLPPAHLIVKAIGGIHLEKVGARIFFDTKYLASVGLVEVLKKLSLYLNLERELLQELKIFNPNLLILVDFPGFNLRILKIAKKLLPTTKIVYYFPPQVWAWNEGRTKILAKYCDMVLCGLPFEEEFHKKHGVNAFYVGNPLINELPLYEKQIVRAELGISKNDILVGLFPGSRPSEIHYMLTVLIEGSNLLKKDFPNIKFLVSQAPNVNIPKGKVEQSSILLPQYNHKLLAASDIVWLTSGTVTLEAALYETPMILGYKSNYLNYLLYLMLRRVDMIGLPNIICGEKIVPELIQDSAKAENYYKTTKDWLENPNKLVEIKTKLKKIRETLGNLNASKQAALRIRELIPEYKVFMMR